MDNRLLAWLVLAASGIYSLLMVGRVVAPHALDLDHGPIWIVGVLGAAGGIRLLWQTGLLRHSPMWRFMRLSFALGIFSALTAFMHWPYLHETRLLALASVVVVYAIHFVLKPRKALRDILRLLVVVLTICATAVGYLHVLPRAQAVWIVLGIVSIAMVEFLFHPVDALDPPAFAPTAAPKPDPADPAESDLPDEHPELFQ